MDVLKNIINKHGNSREKLIQILLDLQEASGQNYLPREWTEKVAKELNIPFSQVYDVVTFYSMFNTEPKGKHVIEFCESAPCHVIKSKNIIQAFEDELNIKIGETTSDGLFTLQHTSCFGACDVAPAVKIGEKVYGNLTEDKVKNIIASYREENKNA